MGEPITVDGDGFSIQIEATPDLMEARQSRIFAIIQTCCDQLGGAASVTLERLASALTNSGIETNRRHAATALNELLAEGQVAKRRRGNRFFYWLPDLTAGGQQEGTQPSFPFMRGGLAAGTANITAPPRGIRPASDEEIIKAAAEVLATPDPAAAANEPAVETGPQSETNGSSGWPAHDGVAPIASGWTCPDHPDRIPGLSKYKPGQLHCTARINGAYCRNNSDNSGPVQKASPSRPASAKPGPQDRTGYVEQVAEYMGPSFFTIPD